MSDFGRIIITIGFALVVIGSVMLIAGRYFPSLGNLPGDFRYEGKNFKVYFPVATMIIVSILGSVLLNIVMRFFK